MSEVFDNNYKLIKSEKMKAKNESEIENCFRTTILKGQWGRGAGRKFTILISGVKICKNVIKK